MLFVQYDQGQLNTSCMQLVLEQWAYCKSARCKYSINSKMEIL